MGVNDGFPLIPQRCGAPWDEEEMETGVLSPGNEIQT